MGDIFNRGTKNRPNYYCRYLDSDGKRKCRATHQPTKELARRFLTEIEARIARGQIGMPDPTPSERQQQALTVGELFERFLSEYSRPRIRNLAGYRAQARSAYNQRIKPYPIAGMEAAKVRPPQLAALRDALARDGFSAGTINGVLRWLSTAFTWAITAELVPIRNPLTGVERMGEVPLDEHYSLDEVQTLLALPNLPPMVAAALYTGMRKGELFGLSWDCVRFDLGSIEVKRSFKGPPKSGRPRTIPLHPELAPILRAWRQRCPDTPERLVFPVVTASGPRMGVVNDGDDIRLLLQAQGCRHDFRRPWHAFRHTFATLFCESGGAPDALERILGHSSAGNRITANYIHASLDYVARELGKLRLAPPAPAGILQLDAARRRLGSHLDHSGHAAGPLSSL